MITLFRLFSSEDKISQNIINHYTGQNEDVSEVVISHILETEKKIINKKNFFSMYKKINADPEYQACVRIHSLNAAKINKIVWGCSAVGAAVGGIFATYFALGTYKGVAVGGVTGFSVGAGYCVKNGLWSLANEDGKIVRLKLDERYQQFKNDCTLEQYRLFKNFIENYVKFVDPSCEASLNDACCSITGCLPEFPVFSIWDTKRLHVYEKSAIEKHLDNVDESISRAILSNARPDVIAGLRTTYDPYRIKPFTKKDLVTDIGYILKMITLMKENLKFISENENLSQYNDPIIKKGLESLLEHYKGQYDECTKVVVDKLFSDCVKLGSTHSMSLDICSEFSLNFEELKKV